MERELYQGGLNEVTITVTSIECLVFNTRNESLVNDGRMDSVSPLILE